MSKIQKCILCAALAFFLGVSGIAVTTATYAVKPGTNGETTAVCSTCRGSGKATYQCGMCKGTGKAPGSSFMCSVCNGTGWSKCAHCSGTGQR